MNTTSTMNLSTFQLFTLSTLKRLRRFFLADPAASAARQAADIADGIVPAGRRYDRELVERMQREAMGGMEGMDAMGGAR